MHENAGSIVIVNLNQIKFASKEFFISVRKFRVRLRCQNANSICRSFQKRTIFHANAFLILCTRRNGCNYARLSFNYRNLSGALCQKGWEMNIFKKLRARIFSSQKMTHACKVILKIVKAKNATFGI